MVTTRRLVLFLRTLNPGTYPKLCEEMPLGDAIKQFFFTFLLFLCVMSLLFFPAVMIGAPRFHASLGSFSSFSLDANISGEEPVTLVRNPYVVADLGPNATMGSATILLTKTGIEWKKYYLFGHSAATWDELRDARDYSDNSYSLLFLFLIPSIVFWVGLLLLVKNLLLVFVFCLLAFLVPRLWSFSISFANTCKVALYAASLMMLVEMTLFPFVRILWLPLLLYILFLIVGIVLVGERDLGDRPAKKTHHGKKEPWE